MAVFALLSGAFAGNVLLLQPGERGGRLGRGLVTGSNAAPLEVQGTAARSRQFAARDGGAPVTPPPEESADLTRAIQRELKAKGYEPGAVDGIAGSATNAAIIAYEFDRGLTLTAHPSGKLLQHLILGSVTAAGTDERPGAPTSSAQALIRGVQGALGRQGLLAGSPTGQLDDETRRAIRRFEAAQGLRDTGRISAPLVARLVRLGGNGDLAQR